MNRCILIPATWLLDQLAGDPEWFPHPVRLLGFVISRGESLMRRPGQSTSSQFLSGASLSAGVVVLTYYATKRILGIAKNGSPALSDALELLLAWTSLAARNLEQEAASVVHALEGANLPFARLRLARIVGRDTDTLETDEICRGLIETLAESASDGIVAPLFHMALGGVPLAMAYKAVNTLDSMIGHTGERYFYFGKAAARMDDLANYLPARLTALGFVLAASLYEEAHPQDAWNTWRRDGARHKSPNAGQPESAIAGALHVRLGGDNTYGGELVRAQPIGEEFPAPSVSQAKIAIRMVSTVTLLAIGCGTLLAACMRPRQPQRTVR